MSRWVSELLAEWRQASSSRLADQSATDHVPRALDLLRVHVKRAGVLLRLTEVEVTVRPLAGAESSTLPSPVQKPATDANTATAPRFGQRRSSRYVDETPRVSRLPREALRTLGVPREAEPAHVPTRASKHALDAGKIATSDTTHERASEDVEALRAEVARLKEALADLVVENRTLRQRLDSLSQMTSSSAQPH